MNCRKCQREIPDESVYCNHCGAKQVKQERKKTCRGNGQGTAFKRGKTWTAQVTYYGRGMREAKTKGGFRTRTEALNALVKLREELVLGITTEHKCVETLRTLHEAWQKTHLHKISKSRAWAYTTAWRRLGKIADVAIEYLTVSNLQAIVDETTETYETANTLRQMLSQLYKLAVAQGNVPSNLAKFITLPAKEMKEPAVPFNTEEIAELWSRYEAGEIFPAYTLLMIYTGMMPGELRLAEKNMINWEERTILGCGLKTTERKTKPIVFPDIIVPVLKRIVENSKNEKLFNFGKKKFYKLFNEMIKDCGFRDELTPYSCRHTTGTTLALSNANLPSAAIQAVMRQRRFESTQHYIHPDTVTARNAINSASRDFAASPYRGTGRNAQQD